MKLHRVELFIVDFEGYGLDDFLNDVENNTDCIVHAFKKQTVNMPQKAWSDDHILNSSEVTRKQCESFFVETSSND